MNEQFTPELLASARTAESPEALLALAAENGATLTPDEAKAHFDLFHQTGELSDEELDNVAGGKGCMNGGKMVVTAITKCGNYKNWVCKKCGGICSEESFIGYDSGGSYRYTQVVHYCGIEKRKIATPYFCGGCKHCTYERSLWLCNNPAAYC